MLSPEATVSTHHVRHDEMSDVDGAPYDAPLINGNSHAAPPKRMGQIEEVVTVAPMSAGQCRWSRPKAHFDGQR